MHCRQRLLICLVVLCCCACPPLPTRRADAQHVAAILVRLRMHAMSVTVCSGACPFATIQAALDSATLAPGATISIVPGIYREHLVVRKPITLQRDPAVAGTAPAIISGGTGGSGVIVTAGTGPVLLRHLVIQGNSPPAGGGIETTSTVTDTGTMIITGSTISGNQAVIGGGIYDHGNLTITNSTISGNQGGWPTTSNWGGGGLWVDYGAVATMTSSTISANSSYGAGGGIYGLGRLFLVDNIVAGNTDTVAPDLDAVVTGGHSNLLGAVDIAMGVRNNVDGNRVGSLQHPLDPLLGPLGNHGGPTPTMALRPGSPALHLGTACPLTDQRGRRRPHAPAHCDAGAYEASTRG